MGKALKKTTSVGPRVELRAHTAGVCGKTTLTDNYDSLVIFSRVEDFKRASSIECGV